MKTINLTKDDWSLKKTVLQEKFGLSSSACDEIYRLRESEFYAKKIKIPNPAIFVIDDNDKVTIGNTQCDLSPKTTSRKSDGIEANMDADGHTKISITSSDKLTVRILLGLIIVHLSFKVYREITGNND